MLCISVFNLFALNGFLRKISRFISVSFFSKKDNESVKLKKETFLSNSYKPLLNTATILYGDCLGTSPSGVETEEDDIMLILSPTTTPNSIARCFPKTIVPFTKLDSSPSIIFFLKKSIFSIFSESMPLIKTPLAE